MANTSKEISGMPERRTADSTAYADALDKSIEIFTSHTGKPIDDIISNGVRPVADAADVDQIVVFRVMDKMKAQFGQIYRWTRRESGAVFLNENLKTLPENKLFSQWLSIANDNDCISLRVSDMSPDELAFLSPFGIKSILLTPIFAFNELWGVVAFQDHVKERIFDGDCIHLLRSTARLCANKIMREEQTRAVDTAADAHKLRKRMAETIHKTAVLFLSQSNKPFREMMTEGIKPIIDLVDIDRFSVFQNFTIQDSLHSSQVYRWEKASGGTTPPNKAFTNITFEEYAPMWEYLFAGGKAENGPVRLMPEQEAATLKAAGAVSAYVTPLFINNAFWGFVLFEDRETERFFDNDSADLMRSAALLCANTTIVYEMIRR